MDREILIDSSLILKEFLFHVICSVLNKRGILAVENFQNQKKYGEDVYPIVDSYYLGYINSFLDSMQIWMQQELVKKMVLIIIGKETDSVLERWVFAVDYSEPKAAATASAAQQTSVKMKGEKDIIAEFAAFFRQLTGSISTLPPLPEKCTFDLLLVVNKDKDIDGEKDTWEECDPQYIPFGSESLPFRSVSTKDQKIESCVSYQNT